ncbi:MAG: response regulator transcription factor, partial [Acidimicrobiales bacterium]|nr:response regulator transcription factor [Acidimicrobiales bacterium]
MTSTDGTPLRVALANDDPIIIEGLRAMLLPFASRVAVVGIAIGDPEIVLTPEEVPEADLLLLDTFDRRAQGVDAARMIMAQDPPFRLVIFTDCTDER